MERHDDNALVIYTDGSCKNKPRRGGYAFRLVTVDDAGEPEHHDYNPPGVLGATIGEMELKACIEALRLVTGRKVSPRKTEPRVVAMRGQVETIRIVVARHISASHHSYKYEVVGEGGADHGAVDDAFAENLKITMRRGRVYEVRFSEGGRGRWIEEVVAEIEPDQTEKD